MKKNSDIIFSKKFIKREGTHRERAEVTVQQLSQTLYEVAVRLNGEEIPDEFKEIDILKTHGRNVQDFADGTCMGLLAAGFEED